MTVVRGLTRGETEALAPFIPAVDLDSAELHLGEYRAPFLEEVAELLFDIHPDYLGATDGGQVIYIPPAGLRLSGIDENGEFRTPPGLALLGHELVHVGQAREVGYANFIYAMRNGYINSPFEQQAYAVDALIETVLANPVSVEPQREARPAELEQYPWRQYSPETEELQAKINPRLASQGFEQIGVDGKLGPRTCGAAVAVKIQAPATCESFEPPLRRGVRDEVPELQAGPRRLNMAAITGVGMALTGIVVAGVMLCPRKRRVA